MGSAGGRLGCPQTYTAELLYAPRNQANPMLWRRAMLPGVLAASWGRRLNETAEATVELATVSLSRECCALLAEVDYWAFEVRLWRDNCVVFEGPVHEVEYTTQKNPMVIRFADVSDWFNAPYGLLNRLNIQYATAAPVEVIATDMVRAVLDGLTPPDWPVMRDYLRRLPGGRRIKYRRGVVNEYVADTIADLQQYGLTWTTNGRALIYMPKATTGNRVIIARLSDEDVFDPVTVTRDGRQLGTVGWGSKTKNNVITRVSYGSARNYYGRHDRLTELNDEDADTDDLLAAAKSAIGGRTGPQIAVSLGPSAQLKASAPITVEQLVCGQVVLMSVTDLCRPLQARMQIVDVQGTWVPGLEKIQVGLVQLGQVDEIEATT